MLLKIKLYDKISAKFLFGVFIMSKGIFENTKYFIIDMDGTFYLDGNIIEGSTDFINKAVETGRDFYFFTNNSSNNVEV